MYFSEFLETCTIRWVLICEGGVGVGKRNSENAFFFEKFYRGHDLPHPRRSLYTPRVETPAPSAPGRTTQHRQQRRPCQIPGRASVRADHATTLPDVGHVAPVCTRYQTDRAGWRWIACAVCLIRHAQTDKIIVNKNIHFLCANPLTKEIKLFTI